MSRLAVGSLILALSGFVTLGVGSLFGLLSGIIALRKICLRGKQRGQQLAIIAIIVSCVMVSLFLAGLFLGP